MVVAKRGRLSTVVEMVLSQDERDHVRATAVLGDLDAVSGPNLELPPPAIAPVEQCLSISDGPGPDGIGRPEIFRHFDVRLTPATGWLSGARAGATSSRGRHRRMDALRRRARRPTPTSLLLLADAFPPAVLDRYPASWVPTLQYSVYVRARPQPGWIQGAFRTRSMVDGLLEEDGEMFDSAGHLVVMSRQLALLRPPT